MLEIKNGKIELNLDSLNGMSLTDGLVLTITARVINGTLMGQINDSFQEISIETRSTDELLLESRPDIAAALEKLKNNTIPYQTATGRAAINVKQWILENYIKTGIMTVKEFEIIPLSFIRGVDHRLYHAIFNSRRKR